MQRNSQGLGSVELTEPDFTAITEADRTEYRIQVAISDYLNGRTRKGNQIIQTNPPFPGMLVTHAYQGRNADEGFFLKALGVRAGIADLLTWYAKGNGYACSFLEIKKPGGYQSPPQKKVQSHCHFLGIPYVIVRSVRDVYNHFVAEGLTPAHHAIIEPDLRTDAQKKQDSFNYNK